MKKEKDINKLLEEKSKLECKLRLLNDEIVKTTHSLQKKYFTKEVKTLLDNLISRKAILTTDPRYKSSHLFFKSYNVCDYAIYFYGDILEYNYARKQVSLDENTHFSLALNDDLVKEIIFRIIDDLALKKELCTMYRFLDLTFK